MIKILSKKQWIELNEVIEKLQKKVSDEKYNNRKLELKLLEEYKINCNLTHTIEDLQEDKRKLASAKGGLNAKINRLENKLLELNNKYNELEEKYKESMTNKYLVKKLKPGRTPKTTSMKLKDCSRVSNITRKVISHYEKDM